MKTAAVDLEGGPVHYADYGGEGDPLVVVHGIGGSHLNCSRLAPYLTERFHVYAIDLVGFGLTPLHGRDASMARNQLLIGDFIAHVTGAPATVVGHSMGGVLAMMLAAGDPPAVSRLVLLCPAVGKVRSPAGRLSTRALNFVARHPRLFASLMAAQVRRNPKRAVHGAFRKYVPDIDDLDPFLLEAHVRFEQERSRHGDAYLGYLQAWKSMIAEAGDIAQFMKVPVSDIEVPTLLIQGAEDLIVPLDFARQAHGLRPEWFVVELPAVGHAPHIQRPERTAELILEWVSRTEPAATPR
jgi:pimeloyl-ACP methyl ester carboxylesterase